MTYKRIIYALTRGCCTLKNSNTENAGRYPLPGTPLSCTVGREAGIEEVKPECKQTLLGMETVETSGSRTS